MSIAQITLLFLFVSFLISCTNTKWLKQEILQNGTILDLELPYLNVIPYNAEELNIFTFEASPYVTTTYNLKLLRLVKNQLELATYKIPPTRKPLSSIEDFKIEQKVVDNSSKTIENLDFTNFIKISFEDNGCTKDEILEPSQNLKLNVHDKSIYNIVITYQGKWFRYQYYDVFHSAANCPTKDRRLFAKLYQAINEL